MNSLLSGLVAITLTAVIAGVFTRRKSTDPRYRRFVSPIILAISQGFVAYFILLPALFGILNPSTGARAEGLWRVIIEDSGRSQIKSVVLIVSHESRPERIACHGRAFNADGLKLWGFDGQKALINASDRTLAFSYSSHTDDDVEGDRIIRSRSRGMSLIEFNEPSTFAGDFEQGSGYWVDFDMGIHSNVSVIRMTEEEFRTTVSLSSNSSLIANL